METRANYVLMGLFTLAVIICGFAFVYWFNTIGGAGDRAVYRIVFDGSVSGLRTGASVLFNGIRVGEVTELKLDPAAPRAVVAMISVEKAVAVRADTDISLEYQGVTGTASIALRGGSQTAEPPAGQPPTLKVDAAGARDVTQAARDAMRRLDALVADNETVLKGALKNIEVFSQALAGNADRIQRILVGAEGLIGGPDGPGDIAQAARAIRSAAENLDARTAEIATGLTRFSNSGLREWERLATDGRRTLVEIERTFKNIDRNPSRLIFGGSSAVTTEEKPPAAARGSR
jgi:phospholipid/cholesterol/gamma-HCH transport system substrate-binding protein